ncbi:hypothetical protein G6O67_002641 [Ophiocordyceps sinensis]|uniref:RING-type domain-containing protein n=1 Tax=Ophiocordyceps sinensis TaxID=72228 RepID=A0A8H4PUK5_9HYPO|nr:hypothetical protein G6O67_002641 [Ophiocordyceps sinensis]
MDPINHLPHGSQRHSSTRGDPVHGPAGSWATGPHGLATPAWLPDSSASPLYFPQPMPRPPHGLDASYFGLQGALPHSDGNLRGAQQQHEALAGLPTPHAPLGSAMHSITGWPSAASTSQGGHFVPAPGLGTVALQPQGFVGLQPQGFVGLQPQGFLALQPQGLVNMGPSGATSSETHSLNPYGQQSVSHFATPHPPFTITPYIRMGTSSSPTTPASHRPGISTVSGRRRHSRGRRHVSGRPPASDHVAEDNRPTMAEPVGGRPSRRASQTAHHLPIDADTMRRLQLARGAMTCQMIASRVALQSLQSVDVNDLPDNEKMCVICYNDFGDRSTEGINEAPLRLPKCKHVFGDHCIRKWLENSDSCPYCRDKLPSVPKPITGQAFMAMARAQGFEPTRFFSEHDYARIMGGSFGDVDFITDITRQGRAAQRRPPPDDAAGEGQRRTRQRLGSPSSAARAQDLFGGSQPRPNPPSTHTASHATSTHTTSHTSYQASASPPTVTVMPPHMHHLGGTLLARAWASQPRNPLRAHSAAMGPSPYGPSPFGPSPFGPSPFGPTYDMRSNPVTFRPSHQASVDGVEQQVSSPMEATPSWAFGPNRNWPL